MNQKPSKRRTQRERSEATVDAMIAAAHAQFGDRGYDAASLDDVCAAAGVTKGALYHHFSGGKPALFKAVVVKMQEQLVAAMSAARVRGADDVLRAVIGAYFDVALEKRFYRITLQDAPAVFGLHHWREIEYRYSLKFIRAGIEAIPPEYSPEYRMDDEWADMLSVAVFGACCEATVAIAMAKEPEKAKAQAIEVIIAMLAGGRKG